MLKEFFESAVERMMHAVITPGGFATLPPKGVRSVIAVKAGYALQELQQQRPEVPGRRYTFIDVDSFTDFLKRSTEKGGTISNQIGAMPMDDVERVKLLCSESRHYFTPTNTEILGKDGAITAISHVAHERHEVSLKLAEDDAWKFWKRLDGTTMDLADLSLLLRARRNDLPKKDILSLMADISLKIEDNAEFKRDKNGRVKFASKSRNVETEGTIPDTLDLAIPVYAGAPLQPVTVDLVSDIRKGENGPELTFTVRIVDPATVQREAWEERVGKVRELLGNEWLVGMGEIAFEKA